MSFSGTTPDLFEYASREQEHRGKKPGQLLIPYAIRAGQLVHISEVESGKHDDCLCAGCGEGLVARKGEKVSHHFAHGPDSNCKGETVLHKVAKLIAAEKIENCVREGRDMWIRWRCKSCPDFHEGNLVKVVAGVEIERSLGPARPDILLRDHQGNPRIAVELVVTHPPEASTVNFYRTSKITLVTIKVKTLEDLEALRLAEALPVSWVDACTRQKCPKCRAGLWGRSLSVIHSHCHKCRGPMRVAKVDVETIYGSSAYDDYGGATGLRSCDCALLRGTGVHLRQGGKEWLNYCPSCSQSVYPDPFAMHHKWKSVRRELSAGLYCDSCDTVFAAPDARWTNERALQQHESRCKVQH